PEGPGTVDNINIVGLADFFEPRVRDEVETGRTITNPQLKLWVSEALKAPLEDLVPEKAYSHKKVQEALELALVRRARRIIEENVDDPEETFKQLQKLYENQPALTTRTGKSIERQAYSTPAPLAYGASVLAHIEPETEVVYEPTAGTGMLLIAAEPDNVIANELDDTRAKALKSQGFKVGQIDATALKEMPQVADVVIMNPPFGKAKEPQVFDGYELTKLEHIIAANALGAMQNEGRAVMIIAAPKVQGEYSKPDWVFGNYIYSHYNVIGDFEVSGDLYARQGAAWPVRVIALHGRHTTQKVGPKEGKIRAKSWEEAYNVIQEILENEPAEVETDEVVPAAAGREPQRPERAGRGAGERREPAGELGPIREPAEPEVAPTGEPAGPERGGPAGVEGGRVLPTGRVAAGRPGRVAPGARQVPREPRGGERVEVPEREPTGRAEREEPGPRVPEVERGREERVAEGLEPARMVGRPAGRAVSRAVQVVYKPASKGPQENENIPKYLEPHVKRALADLEQAVGPVDDFVCEQLQYASNRNMWGHLSANQVDSVALALYRLAKHTAMIIGHQTGVGKGRIAAGIVRHIIKKGEPTLVTFFTARKDLFSDFYRDLVDVGLTEDEIRPLMINADVDIKNQQDRVVFKRHGNRQRASAAIKKAIKGEADYNVVFTTYSQINKETYQQRSQILDLARNRILILDESHRAAGDSNTGEYMRNGLIPTASGVLFMSATYSKRPDTMALYYRTGIIDAFDGDSESMRVHDSGYQGRRRAFPRGNIRCSGTDGLLCSHRT
ncbi:MAG: strawberry notch-like NTP hydrolase domain-containing protein, partial [Planctomycetota bacterium]